MKANTLKPKAEPALQSPLAVAVVEDPSTLPVDALDAAAAEHEVERLSRVNGEVEAAAAAYRKLANAKEGKITAIERECSVALQRLKEEQKRAAPLLARLHAVKLRQEALAKLGTGGAV